MADVIVLYISAASDLEPEREALGRAIAEIPTSLGWRVSQTPLAGGEVDVDAVAQADIHLLLLGGDVRAPVGVEWQAARRNGRRPVLLAKDDTLRTQAGQVFMRDLARHEEWTLFKDTADVRLRFLKLVGEHLLSHAGRYAITAAEAERLESWWASLDAAAARTGAEPTRGGAGDSAIILSTERFVPSQGKLVRSAKG